jgi:glycosyltransferase involved in cell wall biosynthesis
VARYAGIKNNTLQSISDTEFNGASPIPEELQDKTLTQLIVSTKVRAGLLVSKSKPGKQKVAFISNFKQRCGISTYFESLCTKLLPMLDDFKLFVEHNDNPTSSLFELDGYTLAHEQVLQCWKRGEPLDKLIAAVKEFDPDVVLIQHEFGLFPIARYWLSLMTQLSEFRVITTLHSVFPKHQDKIVVEAAIKELVVHSSGAKAALVSKGIGGKITVIPHGCYTADQSKLWNIYRSQHNFLQIGFLLRYKCLETSIKAVALLKDEFPDVFFTGICSETDFNSIEHTTYYNELLGLVNDLGLINHVALIRGFQTDQVISAYMRTNVACLLPYQSNPAHEVFGASGAARLAMASGIPVITSSFHHFDDLPTIKVDGAEASAKALAVLFRDKALCEEQVKKQNEHVAANDWQSAANRYLALITH